MGPLSGIIGMLPGMGAMKQLKNANIDERQLDRTEAIILSMTPAERHDPHLIKGRRRKRIADGSGTKVQEVRALVKQFDQMRVMMRSMANGKMPDPQKLMAMQRPGSPTPKRPRRGAATRVAGIRRDARQGGGAILYSAASYGSPNSDLDEWVPRRTPCGGSSSPINARPRDGRTIETIGQYNPQTDPSTIVIDEERAQPLARARRPAVGDRRRACCAPRASPPTAASRGARHDRAARIPRQGPRRGS